MGNAKGKTVEIALSDHSQEDLLSSIKIMQYKQISGESSVWG